MGKGRATDYSEDIAKEICKVIATTSTGIKKLCKKYEHWPHPDTIYLWLQKHRFFSDLYAKAKRDQVAALVDEIIEISDDSSHDKKQNSKGEMVCDSEYVNRSRLRVDTRKWIAAKLVPRLYGDNAIARELADEIEELKKMLKEKSISETTNTKTE